jgi:hypothetical protein
VTVTKPVISAAPNVEAVLRGRASGKGSTVVVAEGITGVIGAEAGGGDCGEVLVHPQSRITRNNTPVITIAWMGFILNYFIVLFIKDMSN